MKKNIFSLLLLLTVVSVCLQHVSAQRDLSEILESGFVTIAIDEDAAPMSFLVDGEYEGYDVDVAKLVASDLGVNLTIVPVPTSDRISVLENGTVDLLIAVLGANPSRAQSIWFSSAYAPFYSGIFGPDELLVNDFEDLDLFLKGGYTLGVVEDTLQDEEVTALLPAGTEITRYETTTDLENAYLDGEVDFTVQGNIFVAAFALANPGTDISTKFTFNSSPCFVGVGKGNVDLLNWMNVFVLFHTLQGTLNEFSEEWLFEPLPPLPTF